MISLTKDQVQIIHASVDTSNIKYLDVKLELIDHIASAIEQRSDDASFDTALHEEMVKWDVATLRAFVKGKEKYLRQYWYCRGFDYPKRFFQPLMIVAFILLTIGIYCAVTMRPDIVPIISGVSEVIWMVFVLKMVYEAWSDDEQLLAMRSYRETIAGSYSLVFLIQLLDGDGSFSLVFHPLVYSSVLSFLLLIAYAGVFVFLRWLRVEMSRYRMI